MCSEARKLIVKYNGSNNGPVCTNLSEVNILLFKVYICVFFNFVVNHHNLIWKTVLLYRNRPLGCASVRREWFSTWSRTSRLHYSSKALWSSGLPGWTTWSLRCLSPTSIDPVFPGLLDSFCLNGPFTGRLAKRQLYWCVIVAWFSNNAVSSVFFMSP